MPWVRTSFCGFGWELRRIVRVADSVKYVLTPFRKAQDKVVDEVLDTAAQAVEVILKEGPAAAMNRFNRKNEADGVEFGRWSIVDCRWSSGKRLRRADDDRERLTTDDQRLY